MVLRRHQHAESQRAARLRVRTRPRRPVPDGRRSARRLRQHAADAVDVKVSWQLSKNNRLIGVYMGGQKLQPQGRGPVPAARSHARLLDPSRVKKVELQSTLNHRKLRQRVAGYGGYFGDYNAMRSRCTPEHSEHPGSRHRAANGQPRSVGSAPARQLAVRCQLQLFSRAVVRRTPRIQDRRDDVSVSTARASRSGARQLRVDLRRRGRDQPSEILINNYPVTPINRVKRKPGSEGHLAVERIGSPRISALGSSGKRFHPGAGEGGQPGVPDTVPSRGIPGPVLTWNRPCHVSGCRGA